MVFYRGQNGQPQYYFPSDIGREDGQSEVTLQQMVARCNKCGATYTDIESIEMVRKWAAQGYAPCPNISCSGELEIKKAE
ncbi:hypothetical protein ES707_01012 [subsurface metagenome]